MQPSPIRPAFIEWCNACNNMRCIDSSTIFMMERYTCARLSNSKFLVSLKGNTNILSEGCVFLLIVSLLQKMKNC